MIPCLYGQDEKNFTSNGIGKLADCISCTVTEERNGEFELAMEYPVDGIHAEDIVQDAIIYAQPAYDKDPQPFRIYKITTPMDGKLEIDARHVSYQLNYITVSPTTVVSTTDQQPAEAFKALKKNASVDCPFDFETDISSTAYFGILEPVSFRCALGGVDGSMLDTFGGEYEWDKYTVRLLKSRGADNGVRIVYGKNLVDFKQEKNNEDVITGVHPYWRDPQGAYILELPEYVVTLDTDGPYQKIGLLDCSDQFDEEPTWNQMRTYAQSYLEDTTLTEPDIDIDVDFAQLWMTPGYEDIVEAEKVSLCDTVHVYITKLGIEVSTRVTQTVYDVLLERYNSITLSNSPTSARNKSFSLTVATTSQVKTMIAMTDSEIRLSVSKIYVTNENFEEETHEIRNYIDLTAEAITLAYTEKLRTEYSTTEEITSMIELTRDGIVADYTKKFENYSTTTEVESMISLTEEGIVADYTKKFSNYSTTTEVEAMIKLSESGIEATYVKNGQVRSRFAMEDDAITIESGSVTFKTGRLLIDSTHLTLDSSGVLASISGSYQVQMGSGELNILYNNSIMGTVHSLYMSGTSYRGFTINIGNAYYSGFSIDNVLQLIVNNGLNNYGRTERFQFDSTTRFSDITYFGNPFYVDESVEVWKGTYDKADALFDYSGFYAYGDIGCSGTKYRIVSTKHYDNIGMNAYETASAMFGDIGSGTIGEDGQTSVFFAAEFAEVIDMDTDYQVFLTQTSDSQTGWIEKEYDHFIVHGEPGATFDWMISAHQRDYTMNRLETVTIDADTPVEFDESIFYRDNVAENELNEMMQRYDEEVDLL